MSADAPLGTTDFAVSWEAADIQAWGQEYEQRYEELGEAWESLFESVAEEVEDLVEDTVEAMGELVQTEKDLNAEMWSRAVAYIGQAVTIDGVALAELCPFFADSLRGMSTPQLFKTSTLERLVAKAKPQANAKVMTTITFDLNAVGEWVESSVRAYEEIDRQYHEALDAQFWDDVDAVSAFFDDIIRQIEETTPRQGSFPVKEGGLIEDLVESFVSDVEEVLEDALEPAAPLFEEAGEFFEEALEAYYEIDQLAQEKYYNATMDFFDGSNAEWLEDRAEEVGEFLSEVAQAYVEIDAWQREQDEEQWFSDLETAQTWFADNRDTFEGIMANITEGVEDAWVNFTNETRYELEEAVQELIEEAPEEVYWVIGNISEHRNSVTDVTMLKQVEASAQIESAFGVAGFAAVGALAAGAYYFLKKTNKSEQKNLEMTLIDDEDFQQV
jgi:hypothetical protein